MKAILMALALLLLGCVLAFADGDAGDMAKEKCSIHECGDRQPDGDAGDM